MGARAHSGRATARRGRFHAHRLLLVAAGVVLPLVALEGALQVGGLFVEKRSPSALSEGEQTVLCIGDSHTYGAYYPEEFSYPARLQAYLDASLGPGRTRVVRAAWPGVGTGTLRVQLPGLLERYEPDLVLMLAGLNNRWNRTDSSEPAGGWLQRLARRSKLAKLLAMSLGQKARPADSLDGEPPALPRFLHAEAGLPDEELAAEIRADLGRLERLCRQAGSRTVFLTYAPPDVEFAAPNRALRQAARELERPLLDVQQVFAQVLTERPYDELLIPGDYHPRPSGYEVMAEFIAGRLLPMLDPSARLRTPAQAARVAPTISLRVGEESGELWIQGPAGRPYRVFLSQSTTPPLRLPRATLALDATDPLFRATRIHPRLAGVIGADGRARLDLDLGQLPAGEVDALYAAAALLKEAVPANGEHPVVVAASAPVLIPR